MTTIERDIQTYTNDKEQARACLVRCAPPQEAFYAVRELKAGAVLKALQDYNAFLRDYKPGDDMNEKKFYIAC